MYHRDPKAHREGLDGIWTEARKGSWTFGDGLESVELVGHSVVSCG